MASMVLLSLFGAASAAERQSAVLSQRILGGLSFGGEVWLWSDQGQLASVRPGGRGLTFRYSEGVVGLARDGDALLVLRASPIKGGALYLTRLQGRSAVDGPSFAPPQGERPVAFFLASGRPYVLTRTRIYHLDDGGWRSSAFAAPIRQIPFANASFAVTGRKLYVGYDGGEWGGGLQQIDLDAATATDEFGAGPVTGVEVDPLHPGCVLASVGLLHLAAEGRIERACGTQIETVLSRPLGASAAQEGQSEPFFGLARSKKGEVWAVSPSGLYLLNGSGGRPIPLPHLSVVDGAALSFDVSGLVVVRTDLNAAVSLSGSTPLVIEGP